MTKTEAERLAVVETKVDLISSDVSEVKADVKVLLAAKAASLGVTALIGKAAPWVAIIISIAVAVRS